MKSIIIKDGTYAIVETSGDYKDIKRLLEIDSPITIAERKIGDTYYDVWVDDEGLLKDTNRIVGLCMNARELLVGGIVILKCDSEGNTIGLNDKEIEEIQKNIIALPKDLSVDYCDCNAVYESGDVFLTYSV